MFTWEMLIFLLNVPSRIPGYLFIVLYLQSPPVHSCKALTLQQRMSCEELETLLKVWGKPGSHLIRPKMCECMTARLMVPIFLGFPEHCNTVMPHTVYRQVWVKLKKKTE